MALPFVSSAPSACVPNGRGGEAARRKAFAFRSRHCAAHMWPLGDTDTSTLVVTHGALLPGHLRHPLEVRRIEPRPRSGVRVDADNTLLVHPGRIRPFSS